MNSVDEMSVLYKDASLSEHIAQTMIPICATPSISPDRNGVRRASFSNPFDSRKEAAITSKPAVPTQLRRWILVGLTPALRARAGFNPSKTPIKLEAVAESHVRR